MAAPMRRLSAPFASDDCRSFHQSRTSQLRCNVTQLDPTKWSRRREADVDVVLATGVPREHVAHLSTEVALHLQHEAADFARRVTGAIREELLDVGIHAGGGLARPDRADDDD